MGFVSFCAEFMRHLRFGPKVVDQWLRNRNLLWDHEVTNTSGQGSSISDSDGYTSIVRLAAEDAGVFSKFRSNRDYFGILDHVGFALGVSYLALLRSNDSQVLNHVKDLTGPFGKVGKPLTYEFRLSRDTAVAASPTLFRYLKVSEDLRQLFGSLESFRVAEIGVGFGGQAVVLDRLESVSSLAFFDLPDVLRLATRFASECGVQAPILAIDGRTPSFQTSDLVVSNYAFSELRRSIQEAYLESVISKSERGYITWNTLSETHLDGMTANELCSQIPGAEMFAEVPLTAEGNCILVWGHKSGAKPLGC